LRTDWSRNDHESITAALDRVYADCDTELDPVIRASGIETLRRVMRDEAEDGLAASTAGGPERG
jgi:hypothetical protein